MTPPFDFYMYTQQKCVLMYSRRYMQEFPEQHYSQEQKSGGKCATSVDKLNKLQYIYTVKCYATVKKNELLLSVTWLDL